MNLKTTEMFNIGNIVSMDIMNNHDVRKFEKYIFQNY